MCGFAGRRRRRYADICGGGGKRGSGAQDVEERGSDGAQGLAAVADRVLLGRVQLGERAGVAVQPQDMVVPETVVPARGAFQGASAVTQLHVLGSARVQERRRAAVLRGAVLVVDV